MDSFPKSDPPLRKREWFIFAFVGTIIMASESDASFPPFPEVDVLPPKPIPDWDI